MRASPVRMENLVGQALGRRGRRPQDWSPAPRTDMRAFPTRTALTIATFALILAAVSRVLHGVEALSLPAAAAIVEFTPELTPLRPWQPHTPPHARRPPRRPRPLLRRAVAHRTRRALGHHPHPALRRFPHYRRPHHRRHPPAPAKALRRCGPRLHPDRQTLGLV